MNETKDIFGKHLFLFTITPVQSFIEQARKTQDLYAGSFLLSYLCRIAINKLPEKSEIIFPEPSNQSMPNRFLAVVKVDESQLKALGQSIQGAVENEIERLASQILERQKLKKPEGFDEQIKSYFSINWAIIPFEENNYPEKYKEIESVMGAIKPVRIFNQFSEIEKGRKCSICGERNVKFYRMNVKEKESFVKKNKLFSEDVNVVSHKDYSNIVPRYLKSGEGLCAVCFTKRCLEEAKIENYKADFPSTSKIALFDAFTQICKTRTDLKSLIDSDKYDPVGIFALKNKRGLKEFVDLTEEEKENTKAIYKALRDNKIDFTPYYAVMLFDGDNMGEWLSGEIIDKRRLRDFHKELTKKLGEFANYVRREIVPPKGATVYAGGEDFLGFFNLTGFLESIKILRQKFDEIVNQEMREFYIKKDIKMTFSTGIVIAHFKTPLSEVLNWARKAEKEAKDIDGKDAFAIAVLKHSGGIEKSIYKWNIDKDYVVDILSRLIDEISSDRLSNIFIKKLNQEMIKLVGKEGSFEEDYIVKNELSRLIKRSFIKQNCEKNEDFKKRKEETLKELKLEKLFFESKSLWNFLSLLNITDFIARQIKGGF
jgi:CRISPR-associated protein Cmr2